MASNLIPGVEYSASSTDAMDEDILSDVVPSNIVSRQVRLPAVARIYFSY